jgi:antitoxin ParD1/3/4
MREALQLLDERDQLNSLKLESLRQDIQKGVDSGEAAPLNIDAIKARGNAKLAAKTGHQAH